MKLNGMPEKENFSNAEIAAMLGCVQPKFAPMQKVWLKCGMDEPGMILAVIFYPNRYTYKVRWSDATTDEFEEYELTDSKKWD
jgi:hypothetical protein